MQVPILKSTYEILNEKIAETKKEIKQNSKDIGEAADLGDLKENAEYHAAKEKQSFLMERKQRLESYLNFVKVDLTGSTPETVSFGCSVTVVDTESKESHTFNLVGPAEFELELFPDMVTIGAPVARLLVTKKVGDVVEFKFGSNNWTGEITEIRTLE
ncbi:MAG: transcription elongation factor GreA [candidate division Zixibacteria bacterium]|jgi:transcription elongation factor GreA|nr:transcription elongation factor GreA [candidate division Zixibacteria bacterium]